VLVLDEVVGWGRVVRMRKRDVNVESEDMLSMLLGCWF